MENKEKKERALVLMLIPLFFGLIFLIALLRQNKETERTSTSTTINPIIENTKGIYLHEKDSKKLIGIKKMDNFSNFSVIQYTNGQISLKNY